MGTLDALFTEEAEIVDKLLLERLEPFVGLSRQSDTIVPKAPFARLTISGRIIAALAARHAMVRSAVPGATLEADAVKIASQTMVPVQRCREALSRLKTRGLLESNGEGYFVPSSKLLVALEELAASADSRN